MEEIGQDKDSELYKFAQVVERAGFELALVALGAKRLARIIQKNNPADLFIEEELNKASSQMAEEIIVAKCTMDTD